MVRGKFSARAFVLRRFWQGAASGSSALYLREMLLDEHGYAATSFAVLRPPGGSSDHGLGAISDLLGSGSFEKLLVVRCVVIHSDNAGSEVGYFSLRPSSRFMLASG